MLVVMITTIMMVVGMIIKYANDGNGNDYHGGDAADDDGDSYGDDDHDDDGDDVSSRMTVSHASKKARDGHFL